MTEKVLVTMRLKDMERVHPDQTTRSCSNCGHTVGIFPSGQNALKTVPDLKIVCQKCVPPSDLNVVLPGALREATESVRKR
jgi:hypothetical protein